VIKKLVTIANKLDHLGLKKEADYLDSFIFKFAQSSDNTKVFFNTAKYLDKLAVNLNGPKRAAERRGNSSEVARFDALIKIATSLYNSAITGDFANLDNIFKDGTLERKLSLAIDPDYGSPFLNKDSFGQAVGRDIGMLSITPQNIPIKHATKEYFDGMEYGIKDSILGLISEQQKSFGYTSSNHSRSSERKKQELLSELQSFEEQMRVRQDPDDPANYEIRTTRGRDKEWYEEKISHVISPEEASSRIEEKREEVNRKIDELMSSAPSFSPNLTPEQLFWVKRLGIKF
jgi:hypothetical protein